MTEINGDQANIRSVTATTITLDYDNSNTGNFTAFAYPTSAAYAVGLGLPTVSPVGEEATILSASMDNASFAGIYLGSSVVGADDDVWYFEAGYDPVQLTITE